MNYASGTALWARQLARSIGLTKPLASIFWRIGGDYEGIFCRLLRRAVREGDTVWDIGANV